MKAPHYLIKSSLLQGQALRILSKAFPNKRLIYKRDSRPKRTPQ